MLEFILALLGGASAFALSSAGNNSFPPPLDKKEEQELFVRMREQGDTAAREKLIEHNLRLVTHIVRKYYASNHCEDDLISVGSIGLIKSVDSYNITNGTRFATYAARCIQNEILMYFRGQRKTLQEVSINETIDTDRDGKPLTYIDIIKCEDTIADDLDMKIKLSKAADYIMNCLGTREKRIIILRYGLAGDRAYTQREVAQKLGISRSYVSRIEKYALEKLRSSLGGE